MASAKRIAIVGGGIGGLAAAIALLSRGLDVTLFEQAQELGEVGAGLQFAPNAMKVLMALGLEEQVMRTAFEPAARVGRDGKTGRVVATTRMKGYYHEQYGAGYYTFHRADVHAALVRALPPERIVLGAKCTGVRIDSEGAILDFAGRGPERCDVVIGADGIHSVIRESLYGPQSPRFTGLVCWRGLVPAEALPSHLISDDVTSWYGPRSTFVHYRVRSGKLVNWAALVEQDWREESWKIEGDPQEVRGLYEDWHPTIRQLVAKAERLYKWALFDRDPLPEWTRGCVTLLGDAAHPMLPSNSQGGCMALEDAWALGAALAQEQGRAAQALKAYEAARRPRTSRVQLAARAQMRKNNLTSPFARLRRDLGYAMRRLRGRDKHAYGLEWIYGHDVTSQASLPALES